MSMQVALAGTSVRRYMRMARRAARYGGVSKPTSSIMALLLDSLICLLMLLSLWQMLALSAAAGSGSLPDQSQYPLFDGDALAPARFFMPQRVQEDGPNPGPLPGQPGRWAVGQESSAGLQKLSDGLGAVEHLMRAHVGADLSFCWSCLMSAVVSGMR